VDLGLRSVAASHDVCVCRGGLRFTGKCLSLVESRKKT
jgi:hypothetical protein